MGLKILGSFGFASRLASLDLLNLKRLFKMETDIKFSDVNFLRVS
jgi:hypothetical protein